MTSVAPCWAGSPSSSFYLLLALVYPAGMGMGDVKLSGTLGMALAWLGWGEWLVGSFLAFLLGAFVGLGMMLFRGAGRKSAIPFGPFMLGGALLGILAGPGDRRLVRGPARRLTVLRRPLARCTQANSARSSGVTRSSDPLRRPIPSSAPH